MGIDDTEHLLIGIALIGAHIHHEMAGIGHHVMLRAGLDNRDTHTGGSQTFAHLFKTVVTQPQQIFQHFMDGIHPFVAGGMSRLAVRCSVDDHQSALRHCRLHPRGFSHDGHIHPGKEGQYAAESVLAAHLLLSRSHIDIVALPRTADEIAVYLEQGYKPTATVIAAQTVEAVAFEHGFKGVTLPGGNRFDGVDMGIEQDGLPPLVIVGVDEIEVVGLALRMQLPSLHVCLQAVSRRRFVAADRGDGNQLAKTGQSILLQRLDGGGYIHISHFLPY